MKKKIKIIISDSHEQETQSQPPPSTFANLDDNLLFEVFKHVDARTLATAAGVSKQWFKTAHDERLWELLCTKHWTNLGCANQQLRSVVLALGGFRRLHSLYPFPPMIGCSPWGKDEVHLSLSLLSIRYYEKMKFKNRPTSWNLNLFYVKVKSITRIGGGSVEIEIPFSSTVSDGSFKFGCSELTSLQIFLLSIDSGWISLQFYIMWYLLLVYANCYLKMMLKRDFGIDSKLPFNNESKDYGSVCRQLGNVKIRFGVEVSNGDNFLSHLVLYQNSSSFWCQINHGC